MKPDAQAAQEDQFQDDSPNETNANTITGPAFPTEEGQVWTAELVEIESFVEQLVTELKKGPKSELYQLLLKMMDNSNKANTTAQVFAALDGAGVLTTENFAEQLRGPFDDWLRDRVFEAVKEAVRVGIVAPGPNPRGN